MRHLISRIRNIIFVYQKHFLARSPFSSSHIIYLLSIWLSPPINPNPCTNSLFTWPDLIWPDLTKLSIISSLGDLKNKQVEQIPCEEQVGDSLHISCHVMSCHVNHLLNIPSDSPQIPSRFPLDTLQISFWIPFRYIEDNIYEPKMDCNICVLHTTSSVYSVVMIHIVLCRYSRLLIRQL